MIEKEMKANIEDKSKEALAVMPLEDLEKMLKEDEEIYRNLEALYDLAHLTSRKGDKDYKPFNDFYKDKYPTHWRFLYER